MHRELQEELGFVPDNLERKDFFLHHDGKIVLGYVATCSKDQDFVVDETEIREVHWIRVEDIRSGKIIINSYGDFIVKWA